MQRRGVNVVGSANMDLVVRTVRFPAPGETLLGGVFSTYPGGKGANQAVAAGRLGDNPLFVGKVGADGFGSELTESLRQGGVDVSELLVDAAHATGIAVITVDGHGENTIVVASGANMELTPDEVEAILKRNPAQVLLTQMEVPLETVQRAAEVHKGLFILNPAPACPLPDELLRHVDVITPNETETELLTGIVPRDAQSCREAGEVLLRRGVRNVIVTLGAAGCYLLGEAGGHRFEAFKVDPVDTTAAGDAFNGGLAHALSRGDDLHQAIRFASAVAALSTTRQGAQASMPLHTEVEAFIQS